MRLDEFVEAHDVEIAEQRPDDKDIKAIEQDIRRAFIEDLASIFPPDKIVRKEREYPTVFGPGLRKYLTDYGHLQYGNISFYGVDKYDLLGSSLTSQTKYFHKYYPETWGKIAIEERNDCYAFAAADDKVFLFDTKWEEEVGLTDTGMDIAGYMLHRLSSVPGNTLYKKGKIETFDEAWEIFEQALGNHELPDWGQPSAKDVMKKKKEKTLLYNKKELQTHMQLPSKKMLTDECIKLIENNYNIPAETDIWVDKCIAYYFPHGVMLNDPGMIVKAIDDTSYYLDPRKILKPLYKYKGYNFYTWKEIYAYIIY